MGYSTSKPYRHPRFRAMMRKWHGTQSDTERRDERVEEMERERANRMMGEYASYRLIDLNGKKITKNYTLNEFFRLVARDKALMKLFVDFWTQDDLSS